MQKDDTNKLMEEKENLERRLNQTEQQFKEEQEKNDFNQQKVRKEMLETSLEKNVLENEKMEETIKNLSEEWQHKEVEKLSTTQKDTKNKLMTEKENKIKKLTLLDLRKSLCYKLHKSNEEEIMWPKLNYLPEVDIKKYEKQEFEKFLNKQKDATYKLMEEKENLERRLNQVELQLKEEQERFVELSEDFNQLKVRKEMLETNLEKNVHGNEKMEKTIKNLSEEWQHKEIEELSTKQKDTKSKLMTEKENIIKRLNQTEYLLETEKRLSHQLHNLNEEDFEYLEFLKHPSEFEYDLSEMAGLDDIKNEIRDKILEPLKNPDKQLHKRVLFHGPSWDDQYEWIRATAKSEGMCVLKLCRTWIPRKTIIGHGLTISCSWDGRTDSDIRTVMSLLRKLQPVIVITDFDEELFKEIESEDKIIAMTIMGPFIIEEYFDLYPLKFHIPYPDEDQSIETMITKLEKLKIEISDDIDWDVLSNRLKGRFDAYDLRSICNHASKNAKERRGDNAIVKLEDIEYGWDEVFEEQLRELMEDNL